jgi:predicted enzyme related to lactoylglutathione lyase
MRIIPVLLVAAACLSAGLTAASDDDPTPDTSEGIQYGNELLIQIAVRDLDASCAFYTDVMDLTLESRSNELKWAKFLLPTGAGLGVGEAETVKGSGTASINISVRDIEAARATLESRGVTFSGPTLEIPGVVRLADLQDPDGNRIRLAGAAR